MKYLAILGFSALMACSNAEAICLIQPLKAQLQGANIVYVGTVVRSELVSSLKNLHTDTRSSEVKIRHTLVPEIVLKGNPGRMPSVFSTWQYNNPKSRVETDHAEIVRLMPGDTLLVVVKAGEPPEFGMCTATRKWTRETSKDAYSIFRPAL